MVQLPAVHVAPRRRVLMSIDNVREIVNEIYTKGLSLQLPVNSVTTSYIHEPHICTQLNGTRLLLILVKSDAANSAQRMAIRNTWGNISDPNIKLIFLVGYYSIVQEIIDLEAKIYNDVLQGDFVDIYRNNFNKTVMAYTWAVENCLNTQYLFFVDEDFFVNLRNIIQYLRSQSVHSMHNLIVGHLMENAKPFRTKSSKWFITKEEYPYDQYPSYLSGGAILASMNIAKLLKTAFPYVQYIHIDDVYLGLVAKKLNIVMTHDARFDIEYTNPMHLKDIFASHAYGDHRQLLALWSVFLETMSFNSSSDIFRT